MLLPPLTRSHEAPEKFRSSWRELSTTHPPAHMIGTGELAHAQGAGHDYQRFGGEGGALCLLSAAVDRVRTGGDVGAGSTVVGRN